MNGRHIMWVGSALLLVLVSMAHGQATQPASERQVLLKLTLLKAADEAAFTSEMQRRTIVSVADQPIADFMADMQKRGKVEVVSRPFMLVQNDRSTTIDIGSGGVTINPSAAPASEPAAAAPAANGWAWKIDLHPRITADGAVDVQIHTALTDARPFANLNPRPTPAPVSTASARTHVVMGNGRSIVVPGPVEPSGDSKATLILFITPSAAEPTAAAR